jgi:transposase, IS30 family
MIACCDTYTQTSSISLPSPHPYAAWQRGTNENTNGLLRQYFPKKTDFRNISEKEVAIVVKKLNNRPRKYLNYQTPHEVFCQTLSGAL